MQMYAELMHNEKAGSKVIMDFITLMLDDGTEINVDWDESERGFKDNMTRFWLEGINFNGKTQKGSSPKFISMS